MTASQLEGPLLELLFHYALGYRTFHYEKNRRYWTAEMGFSKMGISSISVIPNNGCLFKNDAFVKSYNDSYLLNMLREENIGLKWDQDRNFVVYFQAFPEIEASHHKLQVALQRVIIMLRVGNEITEKHLQEVNYTQEDCTTS